MGVVVSPHTLVHLLSVAVLLLIIVEPASVAWVCADNSYVLVGSCCLLFLGLLGTAEKVTVVSSEVRYVVQLTADDVLGISGIF